ncbi:hypothetical protein BDD12DRAFT_909320 [Trichophaea hybrida]|nr:hypothetical protein BDD12DRAFT_909320 [Trichophaea hybrida]
MDQLAAFISTLPLSPASITTLASKTTTSTCLLLLTHLFPTTTHSPKTPSYTAIQSSHWFLPSYTVSPRPLPTTLTFTPLTTADIPTALKVLSHFRIRSGRLAPLPSSSNTDGGGVFVCRFREAAGVCEYGVEDPEVEKIGPVMDATKRTMLGGTYFGYPALNVEMRLMPLGRRGRMLLMLLW